MFDYFINDHLGNTCFVLTDEQQTDAYPVASMETANAASEKLYYTNIDETRSDKPAGYPDDTYTNPNDKVARLNSNSKKIGPAILLKVMSGDQMNIRANAYYRLNGGSAGSPSNPASELLAALAGSLQGATMNKYGMFQIQNSGVLGPGIADLLQRQTDQYAGSTRPKAYLNWVLLDEQFKIVNSSSGFEQVGADGEFKTFVKTGLPISQNGYLYVYTSNESPVDVFFDNLQVSHIRGPLLEETHYYPFGLTMAGISSKAAGILVNKKLFNSGSELQNEEFSDGSGLEWYDVMARFYDPQLGRFMQVDPMPDEEDQESWEPYQYGLDNPIKNNDPDGKFWTNVIGAIVGAGVEYGSQVVANIAKDGFSSKAFTKNIDLGDIAIAAGEGFLTSGTSAIKNTGRKVIVKVGAELLRNKYDIKEDGSVNVNSNQKVIINTVIGLTTSSTANALPIKKANIIKAPTPKGAVKLARATTPNINRVTKNKIMEAAKQKQQIAESINSAPGSLVNGVATGAPGELIKRKVDKAIN